MTRGVLPRPFRVGALALGLVFAAILAGCTVNGSVQVTDQQAESFPVGDEPYVVVETFNGRVTVEATARGTVEARITRRGSGVDEKAARKDLASVFVTTEQDDDRVTITARRLSVSSLGNNGADMDVQVPEDASVELRTSNGRVEVANVRGAIVVRTSNGAVTTRGGTDLDLDTTNGDVSVNSPTGTVRVRTSNGGIDVLSATDASVNLRSSNASVTFSGTLARGTHSLVTSNGGITITLPRDTAFRFDGQTINGSVRTEFTELTLPDSTHISGSAGRFPRIAIVARTTNGNLDVMTQRP
jgi:DUF4097 and DUF4098 domain-containing protein YvlB